VGARADWPPEGPLHDRPLAGWQRLREGLTTGIEIGAHTRTHPRLTECSDQEAIEEIEGSLRDLGRGLRHSVVCFAYPGGDEDTRTRRLVTQAGFAAACTSRAGKNSPCEPLERLRRAEIRGNQGLVRFLLAITLGHPTLRPPRIR
jgi:peptidoglycan/xylan/chitin deacetylase (PgdA/CDA1 family)